MGSHLSKLVVTPVYGFKPFVILQALPQLKKLEEINFGDCLILNGGAEALAEGLIKGHQCLKVSASSPFANIFSLENTN